MKKTLLFGFLLAAIASQAQDRLFTYTYQSSVLNKGQKELEIWTTMRNTREDYYRAFDHRLEFEVGLGSKLQTAFYLNYGYSKGIESMNNMEFLISKNSYSFANEWKYKLSDPVVNIIGSALYFEYKLGTEEIELEGKLIFDKQIGKTLQAFNAVFEYEFKNEFESNLNEIEIEKENEIKLNLYYGANYDFHKNFSMGLEFQNLNTYEDSEWEYSILSAGPSLSYHVLGFWVNLTCLPQIVNFNTGKQDLIHKEKVQTRLIFSYVF